MSWFRVPLAIGMTLALLRALFGEGLAQRGTSEQWIKEGKYALNWTRHSCHGFAENQV